MKISYADYIKKSDSSVLIATAIFSDLQRKYSMVKISDIAMTTSGGTPSRGNVEYYNGEIPWVKSGELNDNYILSNEEYITAEGLKNSSAKLLPPNTLLIAMYGATVGKVGITTYELTTNQAVCAVFPNEIVSQKFLFWFFKQNRYNFITLSKGGAQPNISQTVINNTKIPLPDIEVQNQITEYLDNIVNAKESNKVELPIEFNSSINNILSTKNYTTKLDCELNHQLELVKKLRQSLLQDAVQGKLLPSQSTNGGKVEHAADLLQQIKAEKEKLIAEKKIKKEKPLPPIKPEEIPFEIPSNWVWCRLGDICIHITDGEHVTPQKQKEGRLLLSAKNIRDGFIVYDNVDYISEEDYQKSIKRCKPEKNDVLIVSVGGTIGRSTVMNDDVEFAIVRSVALIKPYIKLMANYIKFILDSPILQKEINGRSWGTAQPCLYINQIKELTIPLPPLAEQNHIVQKLDELMQYCNELEASIKACQQQNQQLTQQVLSELLQP